MLAGLPKRLVGAVDDFIGEFVDVIWSMWKMLGQGTAAGFHGSAYAFSGLALLDAAEDFITNVLPMGVAHFFVDALVADDDDAPFEAGEVDQNSVGLARPVKPAGVKFPECRIVNALFHLARGNKPAAHRQVRNDGIEHGEGHNLKPENQSDGVQDRQCEIERRRQNGSGKSRLQRRVMVMSRII